MSGLQCYTAYFCGFFSPLPLILLVGVFLTAKRSLSASIDLDDI